MSSSPEQERSSEDGLIAYRISDCFADSRPHVTFHHGFILSRAVVGRSIRYMTDCASYRWRVWTVPKPSVGGEA